MTEFHMYEYLPFQPLLLHSTGFSFPVVRLPCKLHPSQMRLARLIVHLEEQNVVRWKEDSEEFSRTVHSHLISFNMSPVYLEAVRGRPPSNGTNWQHQASHE